MLRSLIKCMFCGVKSAMEFPQMSNDDIRDKIPECCTDYFCSSGTSPEAIPSTIRVIWRFQRFGYEIRQWRKWCSSYPCGFQIKREDFESATVPTTSVVQTTTSKPEGKRKSFSTLTDAKECFVLELMSRVERIPTGPAIWNQERITTCSLMYCRVDTDSNTPTSVAALMEACMQRNIQHWKNETRSPHRNALVLQGASLHCFAQLSDVMPRCSWNSVMSVKIVVSNTNQRRPCTDPSNELIKAWQQLLRTSVKKHASLFTNQFYRRKCCSTCGWRAASTLWQSKKPRERWDCLMKSFLHARNWDNNMVERKRCPRNKVRRAEEEAGRTARDADESTLGTNWPPGMTRGGRRGMYEDGRD